MGTWEWPLILFTVLGQTAVGIILCLWVFGLTTNRTLLKNSVLISGLLLVAAMLISVFHLGHPLAAYRALTHLSTSWLSREILFFALTFGAWIFLYRIALKPNGRVRRVLGITTGLGLLGVISSALIYTLPRVPAWNNMAPILFFLLTTLILGSLTTAFLGRKSLTAKETTRLLVLTLGSLFAGLLLFILYFSLLKLSPEGTATAQFLLQSPIFWLRALIGWLLPLALLLYGMVKKEKLQPRFILLVFSAGLIGELLGRALFYLSAVGIHITARL